MKTFMVCFALCGGALAMPTDIIDAELYANKALNTPLVKDASIKADRGLNSPSAASALAYLKQLGSNDMCGASTQAYLEQILAGSSPEKANSEATRVYIEAHNRGEKPEPGSACEASANAWQQAEKDGTDPVLASALAFMDAHPNIQQGNPCAASGKTYVKAVIEGKSHTEANFIAAGSFAEALISKASRGEAILDPACAEATKSFFSALETKPSPPNAAAMLAFIDKAFSVEKFDFDPICWKSTEAFFNSYSAGNDELTSNLAAAEVFLNEFAKGSKIPADSPCAAATKAYYENIQTPPSPPNKAAMEAFMDKMIGDGVRSYDPVCAESTKAYFNSYKNGATELDSNLAAAEAFFAEFAKGSTVPADSACAAATRAYFASIPSAPSSPNKAAMVAFMDKLIGGGVRSQDPVCAKSAEAYFAAYKSGSSELQANLAAAEAFAAEFSNGLNVPVDSPCAAATKAYIDATAHAPSGPNKAAMEAFMSKMIADGKRAADPVCGAATLAYFKAHKSGLSETRSNLDAARAFFDSFNSGLDIPADSPCVAATRAYTAALPRKPSGPNSDAMTAFIDHVVGTGQREFDPVCAAASTAFFDASVKGDDELTSNLKAAQAFVAEYKKGSKIGPNSACAAATRVYFDQIKHKPSVPNSLAMIAFIDESIKSETREIDPVCLEAAEAYFDNYLAGKSEAASNEAAGVAYVNAINKSPNFTNESPCGKAADVYMKHFGL